jgi:hypothetical protein
MDGDEQPYLMKSLPALKSSSFTGHTLQVGYVLRVFGKPFSFINILQFRNIKTAAKYGLIIA